MRKGWGNSVVGWGMCGGVVSSFCHSVFLTPSLVVYKPSGFCQVFPGFLLGFFHGFGLLNTVVISRVLPIFPMTYNNKRLIYSFVVINNRRLV